MTHDNLRPPGRDPELEGGLRELLAPPGGEGYWQSLEARIMARITGSPAELQWWSVLARWERPALVAAAVLMLAAGVALVRQQWVESQEPYSWAFAASSAPVEPVGRAPAAIAGAQSDREATLRFLLER